jgi:hypothetical protein
MRCSDVRSKIDEYLDGELTVKTGNKIERHISECSECRAHVEITREMIKTAPALFIPEGKSNWEYFSANLREIFVEKKADVAKRPGISIPGFGAIFSAGRLIPIYSAVSAIIIFGLCASLFVFLTSSSKLIASEDDRFLMQQIEAAENIFKANIKILKEELISVENSLPSDVIKAVRQANRDIEDEIGRCSRLAQIYPAERLIVEKLFESYRMQIKLYKDLIKNIQSQEA